MNIYFVRKNYGENFLSINQNNLLNKYFPKKMVKYGVNLFEGNAPYRDEIYFILSGTVSENNDEILFDLIDSFLDNWLSQSFPIGILNYHGEEVEKVTVPVQRGVLVIPKNKKFLRNKKPYIQLSNFVNEERLVQSEKKRQELLEMMKRLREQMSR